MGAGSSVFVMVAVVDMVSLMMEGEVVLWLGAGDGKSDGPARGRRQLQGPLSHEIFRA